MKKLLMILLATALCISWASAENGTHYVDGGNADRVHLRLDPNVQSDSLGLYYTGTPVQPLMEIVGGWMQVRIGAETGYMMTEYLSEAPVLMAGPVYEAASETGTWVNLRSGPRSRASVTVQMTNGLCVQALGQTASGWHYVLYNGQTGYVRDADLRPSDGVANTFVTQIVGITPEGDGIHACKLENGQTIYFVSAEDTPFIERVDVNFDGAADLAVTTTMGASNACFQFFVWQNGQYVYAPCSGLSYGLCNYQLIPEAGLVATYANNGNAELLHVWNLYRWEGASLTLTRSAISDEWTEDTFEGSTYTQIIHGDMLHVTVRDHSNGYEDSVLWEIILPKDEALERDILTEEMEAFWQGVQ